MDDILSLINQLPGVEEVWEERHFTVYRKGRALKIVVSDQGPAQGVQRYMASAVGANDGDTEVSHGNPAGSVEEALDNVHWWQFD